MQTPLFDGKPHSIVSYVLKYLETVDIPNAKDKVSFSQVKRKICKDVIAPLLGIDMGFNKHPNVKGLDGMRRRSFLLDTLSGCKYKLNLNKSTVNHGMKMVMEGMEVKVAKINHAAYRYRQQRKLKN